MVTLLLFKLVFAGIAVVVTRWLVPVSSRGYHVTIVRHAGETRDKEAREKDKKSKQIWRRAAFFVLGYFCPVLNEIRVYPRLYLISTTSVNSLYSRKIVSGVQCSSFKGKTEIDRGGDWDCYHKLSFLHKSSQTLQTSTNLLVQRHWSPSCLIHRQLHQRGHRRSHGILAAIVENFDETTANNRDKCPKNLT